ncbi:DUF6124 family protein [Pseudomonas sp. LP_7_YM]|uniref:DUF6124 family protein n=1 Tax=Pseudomonas sp. LP_7_YM TaxID=2485137 RepID=UPI0010614E76|nr:DUF3077 domain-containing protein [Pseudomonas sp. LP_7_YM]TDV66035.1 DUF3077 family protein [Pseudomonas sp. LP_7_YM]
MVKVTPDPPDKSLEESLAHASGLLRCAHASACESAENLTGVKRDLAFSVVHLIDMAKAVVDRSLDAIEVP